MSGGKMCKKNCDAFPKASTHNNKNTPQLSRHARLLDTVGITDTVMTTRSAAFLIVKRYVMSFQLLTYPSLLLFSNQTADHSSEGFANMSLSDATGAKTYILEH